MKTPPIDRQKLASFFTDTGILLIGDPCQLIPDGDDVPYTYDKFREAWGEGPEFPPSIRLTSPSGQAVAVAVNVGVDGWYPVYHERDADGAERIVIELGGQVHE